MSAGSTNDGPRDQAPDDYQTADEPTTGPPAGAASTPGLYGNGRPRAASTADTPAAGKAAAGWTAGNTPAAGSTAGSTAAAGSTPARGAGTTPGAGNADAGTAQESDEAPGPPPETRFSRGSVSAEETNSAKRGAKPGPEARKRRKRRLIIAAVAAAAALVVIALCAGGLAVLRAFRVDAGDARDDRRLRDSACLELENRLNHLIPPGATGTPQARAVAIRDENGATRIYVGRVAEQRVSDGWRELLDARTSFSEALDAQAKTRTTAFFVAPAPRDDVSLADQLTHWSPAACAGPIRRLAAPDL